MTDREKVILGLEHCANWAPNPDTCDECPYGGHGVYGCAQLPRDALELLKAQRPVTLADMLVIRVRTFLDESEVFHLKYQLEQQIRNGDRVLILPDFLEPVIVPKDTEVHIENTRIGTVPRKVNPSLSVNPPRIVPKYDKKRED